MSDKRSLLANASLLGLGQGLVQASQLARYVILARLINPAEFGIAALFAMALQVVEMLTNVSVEAFVIQAPDGDDPQLQSTLQLFRAIRGVCSGLLIALAGGSIARLFGVPQAAWAFRILGLLPALRGFANLDISRLQRHLKFFPSVATEAGASWFATLTIAPVAYWLRDHRAMLAILLAQGLASLILSHALAERRYRLAWKKELWTRLFNFGWPLTVNGLLMFGIFQGDRIVVGSSRQLFAQSAFTMADLGLYSAALSLTQAPTMLIATGASSLFLPVLSRLQSEPVQFNEKYVVFYQGVCLTAAVTAALFFNCGSALVRIVFGEQYSTGGLLVGLIGAMWAMRIIRVAPTIAALAVGDTKNTMIANGIRSLGLIGMFGAAALGGKLFWIPLAGVLAEILSLTANIVRLQGRTPIDTAEHTKPTLITLLAMCLAAMAGLSLDHQPLPIVIPASILMIGSVAAVMMMNMKELRSYVCAGTRAYISTWKRADQRV